LDDLNDDATGQQSQRCKETKKLEELMRQKTRRGHKDHNYSDQKGELGDEIFDIKNRSITFKINMIITTEFLSR
jgi:NTP pyrophosphatase (non-canonical NTP hydrolase)